MNTRLQLFSSKILCRNSANWKCRWAKKTMRKQGHAKLQEIYFEIFWRTCYYVNKCIFVRILKLRQATAENQASCSMRHPPPCLGPLFVVTLSFMASLHQRFMIRWNGCGEGCSCVNWSVSARLKPPPNMNTKQPTPKINCLTQL